MYYRYLLIALCWVLLVSMAAHAQTVTYDFQDPKGVNSIAIVLDSRLEPSVGMASGMTGFITIDPLKREIRDGEMRLPATGVAMSNKRMTSVLHSSDWLDVERHPEIVFKFRKVAAITRTTPEIREMTVEGDLTLKGVTRRITVPLSITFLPGQLRMRNRSGDGDLLILRATFHIKRKDFNIKPDMPGTVVGDRIRLEANVAAGAGI